MITPEDQTERALQEWFENGQEGNIPADVALPDQEARKDLEAYHLLFRSLNEKPAAGPSYAFSANVTRKIQTKKEFITAFRGYLIFPLGLLVLLFISYIAAAYFRSSFAATAVDLVVRFRWQFFFGACCLTAVQYLDRQLVKKKFL